MEQVHTVVHLAGGAEPPAGRSIEWFNEELTDVAVRAAASAEVVRFVATSELGADPASPNPYLRSRGIADDLVRTSGLQFAVLRCSPVLGSDTPLGRAMCEARASRIPAAPGDGRQMLNPVWAGDVAVALSLTDAREAVSSGVWELGGPEYTTYDDLVRRVAGCARVSHRRAVRGLPRVLAGVWARDACADATAFLAQFPFERTGLDDAIKESV